MIRRAAAFGTLVGALALAAGAAPPPSLPGLCREAERTGVAARVGVCLLDERGRVLAAHRPDADYPSASLIKIPVMLAVLEAWQEGRIPRTEAGWNRVARMIQNSDNPATNELLDAVGVEAVNRIIRAVTGAPRPVTRLTRKLAVPARGAYMNRAAPSEIARMLLHIHQRERAGDPAGAAMLRVLRGTWPEHRDRIAAGIPVAWRPRTGNKTGTLRRVVSDAALVETPSGARYILVVILDGVRSREQAEAWIRRFSAACWARYSPPGRLPGGKPPGVP